MSDLDIDEEPTTPPTYDQIVHQFQELRKEARKARYLQEDQIAGLMAEVGQLSSLVRESEKARAQDMRSINGAIGELAEGQGRVLAELAARARQDSIHEDEITGVKTAIVKADAKADTALTAAVKAQAKQVGLKAAGWAFGVALFEALRWLMAATGKG